MRFLILLLSLLSANIAHADITANGQVKRAQLEKLSSDPTCAAARVYYNTTSHVGKLCHNSTWYSLVPNLMDSSGDLLVGGASGVVTKLDHPGTANRVLKTTSTSATGFAQVVNADIDAAAAIDYSKLSLSGSIATGDLASGLLVPLSKGGSNKNMTAVNGGVVWTDSNSMEVTSAGTEGKVLKSVSGAPSFSWPESTTSVTNAGVTLTDTDGYTLVIVTISSSTARTVTLPAAANNTGRRITIRKLGSGAGRVIVSGTTETINLYLADESITAVSDGSNWYSVNAQWAAGAYSPTATATSNTSSVSAQGCYFSRNKDIVTVSGNVTATIDGTADAILSVTLPIGAGMNNFSDVDQAGGGGSAWKNSPNYHVPLIAQSVASSTTVTLRTEGASASSGMTWSFSFQYKIQNP